MIGLVCLEQVLAEAGWSVSNLGADLPAADLGQFVRRNDVSLVALSAVNPERVGTLADTVRAVREAGSGRGIPVIVGGQIAAHPGALEASGADALVATLAEALAYAEAHRPAETSEPGSD